jgi:small subunit ribosomal protein S3
VVRGQEAVPGARPHGLPCARVPRPQAEGCVGQPHSDRARREEGEHHHSGIVIGKKGEDIEKLRQDTARLLGMSVGDVRLNISEIRKPELDSKLVADSIAQQIEKRVMFRRAMKRAVMSTMRSGALGVKVRVSGRLNGSEIARTEWYREGRIPLHTFRADIDYGLSEAHTTYGIIGVKVWIFKGEVFDKPQVDAPVATGETAESAPAAAATAPAEQPA